MPKTTKPFDWEIYEGDEFVDIVSMTRHEMKEYRQLHPEYIIKELGYTDDGTDDFSKIDSQTGRNVYRVRISRK